MRLFYQLTEEEQKNAIDYCVNLILEDVLEGDLGITPENDEQEELVDHISDLLEKIEGLEINEKVNKILDDKKTFDFIYDVSFQMAQSAYYHEPEEMVIFPAFLEEDENEENIEEEKTNKISKEIKSKKSLN